MWTPAEIYGDKDMIYDLFEEMILFLEFDFKYEQTCRKKFQPYPVLKKINLQPFQPNGQGTD